ncbi:MAG: GspE/PulE family protein, partial [Candidatus Rokuibacteriota bacterium]
MNTSLVDSRRVGELLVQARIITPDVLEEALARATRDRQRVGEALVAMGAASAEEVLKAVAAQQELPWLEAEELPSTLPALKELSPHYLRQYVACPIAVEGTTVTVATADPANPLLLDELQQRLPLAIKLFVAPGPAILEAIERAYGANTALQKIVEGMGSGADRHADPEDDVDHLRDMAFEAPVVRLVNLLIEGALAAEASDIHIEPFEDSLRVRYRIDGLLYDQEAPPRRLQAALTSRIKIMAEMNIAERRLPQDGRIRVTAPGGRRVDIRVSTVPTIHGESIVMRLLDRSSVFLPFDRLGFSPAAARAFELLIRQPHGILLVTGPTGSGKTTTLYAALDKINRPDQKIITVEDPVEYQLKGVNQIPVRPKIGLSFAAGLRHIVRQDPDVIMVGEMRDFETAEIAIQSALTGHLVFSTLHTNDAPTAVTRLVEMGIEDYLVASAVNGILAQRLVRTLC